MKNRKSIFAIVLSLIIVALAFSLTACSKIKTPDTQFVTVNFVDYNGNVLYSASVESGKSPVYNGQTPTREADEAYSYVFSGWESGGTVYDAALPAVTKNTKFTATYTETAVTYEIIFSVGGVVTSARYAYGSTPEWKGSTEVTVNGTVYLIVGWDKEFAPVTGSTTYTALLEPKDPSAILIAVTFDVDGETLVLSVVRGSTPKFYGTPYRRQTVECSYRFVGWRDGGKVYGANELPAATAEVTYYAEFEPVYREYNVSFLDYDMTELYSATVRYGDTPVYGGAEVTRERTEQFRYVFGGWELDGTFYSGELPAVYGDTAFVAAYEKVMDRYTLTINYYEGEDVVGTYTDILGFGDNYRISTPIKAGLVADAPYVAGVITEDTQIDVHYAEADVWDGSSAIGFASGDGSASNPYIITTAAELSYLASSGAHSGEHFRLNNNIDLDGREWKAIGSYAAPFAGVFDGDGYSVVGLNYNSTLTNDVANSGHALFSTISGTVKNLTVSGTVSSVARYTAVVVGNNAGGTVTNCTAYGAVYGYGNVGGVVGISNGLISGCVNYADVYDNAVTGAYRFGGVVGTLATGSVSDCVNYGAVKVKTGSGPIAGVVGYMEGAATTVSGCINYGYVNYVKTVAASTMTYTGGVVGLSSGESVTDCKNYGPVDGADRIGGVLAWTRTATLTNSVNHGAVIGTQYVGGVIGVSRKPVTNCKNYGMVRATSSNCGGIVGSMLSTVSNCVNHGDIYSSGTSHGGIVGALSAESGLGEEAKITGSKNYGKVINTCTGTNATAGGIAGRSDSIVDSKLYAVIESCENFGAVTSDGSYTGGIVGACNGAKVLSCINYAVVDGGVGAFIAGIAGSNYGYGLVSGCVNYGTVIGMSTIGGICGQLTNTSTATDNTDYGKSLIGKI